MAQSASAPAGQAARSSPRAQCRRRTANAVCPCRAIPPPLAPAICAECTKHSLFSVFCLSAETGCGVSRGGTRRHFRCAKPAPFGHQILPAIRPIGGERGIYAPRPMENCLMERLSTGDVCAACNTRFPSLAWIRQFPTCFHAQDERLPLQGRQKGREEPDPAIPIAPKAPFPTFLPIPAFPRYCLRSSA